MKLLSLVRHAAADPSMTVIDRARPLNERGVHTAAAMARRWCTLGLVPDLLLASPAERAHQTALGFAAEFRVDTGSIRLDERLYNATPGDLLEVIHGTPDPIRHLMIFAHNPGISDLARLLCADLPLAELAPAAVCTFRAGARSWRRIEVNRIALIACEQP